jgi:hypothetical protein
VLFALKGDTGATGATGTQWYSGAAVPTPSVPSTARSGDYYLQTSTAMIYKKDSNGSWSSVLVLSYNTASFIYTPHMMSWELWESDAYFNAVAYGTSGYVAVGSHGSIVHSPDGTNWRLVKFTPNYSKLPEGLDPNSTLQESLPSGFSFYDVAFGNGKYVAVGYYEPEGPECMRGVSSNGENWDFNQLGSFASTHVTFLNGVFFISSDSGTIYTSTDGSSWNTNNSGRQYLSEVAYGNSKYIVFSSYANGRIQGVCTSSNGETWTYTPLASMKGLTNYTEITSVVFGSGLFVAVGTDGGTGIAMIWISPDGINWSSQDLPVSGSTEFFDIAYGNGFAVVGFDGFSSPQNVIATSANGISWNIQTLPYSLDLSGIAPASPTGTFVIAKGQQRGR